VATSHLNVPVTRSVQHSLNSFAEWTSLGTPNTNPMTCAALPFANLYNCNECGRASSANKRCDFFITPQELLLQLSRFDNNGRKVCTPTVIDNYLKPGGPAWGRPPVPLPLTSEVGLTSQYCSEAYNVYIYVCGRRPRPPSAPGSTSTINEPCIHPS